MVRVPRPCATLVLALVMSSAVIACSSAGQVPSPPTAPTKASPSVGSDASRAASAEPSVAASAEDQLSIVAIGDSLPYNLPADCPGCVGFVDSYGAALEERLGGPVDVLNRSRHDGAQTNDIATELSSPGLLLDELRGADVIIVSFGFNDLPPFADAYPGCPTPPTDQDPVETWARALADTSHACVDAAVTVVRAQAREVFARLREIAPNASIGALTAYDAWTGWPALDELDKDTVDRLLASIRYGVEAWNTALCEEADAASVTCVDVHDAFNGADGTLASGDLLAADYTHPSQAGNDRIRDVLLESGLVSP